MMIDFEKIHEKKYVELKSGEFGVPRSVYETISAFANTDGGDIYLGISEDRPNNKVIGIKNIDKYVSDILNTVHNNTKVSFPVISEDDFESIPLDDDRFILAIHVKEAARNIKPIYLNNSISQSYGRDKDGDYVLSKNQIKSYLNDNQSEEYDVLANMMDFNMDDVDLDTLHKYRKELDLAYPNSVYYGLSDEDFLKTTASLVLNKSGKYVLSNAAVVMFTSHDKIIRIYPNYLLDYQRIESSSTKWDNRIVSDSPMWSGNLFDFYLQVMNDLIKDIPSSYVSINGKDMGKALMVDAVKEALCNAFSNHSFFLSLSLKIVRTNKELILRNNGKMLVDINRALVGGISKHRNTGLISFFRRIGVADRSGTGIPKIVDAMNKNNYQEPRFIETSEPEDNTTLILTFDNKNKTKIDPSKRKILEYLNKKPISGASIEEISSAIGYSRVHVSNIVNELIKAGLLVDNGRMTKGKLIFIATHQLGTHQ